jgi:hypothetical protein
MSTETEPAAEQTRPAPPSEDSHFIASVVGAAGDHDAPLLRRLLNNLGPPDLADVIEHVLDAGWHGWSQIPHGSAIAVLKARYSLSSRDLLELLVPTTGGSGGLLARLARTRNRRRVLTAIAERAGRSADDLRYEFATLRAKATALVC